MCNCNRYNNNCTGNNSDNYLYSNNNYTCGNYSSNNMCSDFCSSRNNNNNNCSCGNSNNNSCNNSSCSNSCNNTLDCYANYAARLLECRRQNQCLEDNIWYCQRRNCYYLIALAIIIPILFIILLAILLNSTSTVAAIDLNIPNTSNSIVADNIYSYEKNEVYTSYLTEWNNEKARIINSLIRK